MLRVLLKKEIIQFRRNVFLPRLMFAFPVLIMLIMPWLMRMDISGVQLTVIDNDRSSLSRQIISHLRATSYFTWVEGYADYTAAVRAMDGGDVDVIVQIPEDLEKNLVNGTLSKPIAIEANGVNAMKGGLGTQYSMQVIAAQLKSFMPPGMEADKTSASLLSIENRYNPTQNARYYMTPAIMIIVILLICGFLPALNIVSEKEAGTMEQMNVMPVSAGQFILAKLIPYWVMGFLVFSVCVLLAWLVYGLVPAGHLWVIMLGAVLFIMVMSAFSVFLANISDTLQQTVFMMFFFLLIFMLLSGLLTPIESMPVPVQYISKLFPPGYFIRIMRSVYLRGSTFIELWPQFAQLFAMTLFFGFLAVKTHKKQN